MKKSILTIFLILMVLFSGAQELGITAGANISYFRYQKEYFRFREDWQKSSAKVGGKFGIKFSKDFGNTKLFSIAGSGIGFETGLFLSQAGGIVDWSDESKTNNSLIYLELPCVINLNLNTKRLTIQLKAGTYVSTGLWGKVKWTYNGNESTRKIDWQEHPSSHASDYEKYDFGLLTGLGFAYKKIGLNIFYKAGLTDIYSTYLRRNQAFEISLSYRIMKFKQKNK